MGYDRTKAAPSAAAHDAAEALDKVYEALADGLSVTDLRVLPALREVVDYLFDESVSKGELISRTLQVLSLLERDNALLADAIQETRK